jgi:hypothetical protein
VSAWLRCDTGAARIRERSDDATPFGAEIARDLSGTCGANIRCMVRRYFAFVSACALLVAMVPACWPFGSTCYSLAVGKNTASGNVTVRDPDGTSVSGAFVSDRLDPTASSGPSALHVTGDEEGIAVWDGTVSATVKLSLFDHGTRALGVSDCVVVWSAASPTTTAPCQPIQGTLVVSDDSTSTDCEDGWDLREGTRDETWGTLCNHTVKYEVTIPEQAGVPFFGVIAVDYEETVTSQSVNSYHCD